MRLATWNVNSLKARHEHLLRWLGDAKPDVVCLQETKLTDDQFPRLAIEAAGYPHVVFHGQKTYNGVAMLSKLPLEDVSFGFREDPDPQCRLVRATVRSPLATVGGVRVFGAYVPNGQAVGSDKFQYKLAWLERFRREIAADASPDAPVAVVGDMNIALSDLDVWDPFEAEGEVMYHPLERAALRQILDWGLVDVYRHFQPDGKAFTWWDYRMLGFQKNHGYRIDHVFVTKPLLARAQGIELHRPTRKWDKPSDHIPITVDFTG